MSDILNIFVNSYGLSKRTRDAKYRRWTKEEDERLLELSFKLNRNDISRVLNRSIDSISQRIRHLRSKGHKTGCRGRRPWTKRDDRQLLELIPYKSDEEISIEIGRTMYAVKARIKELRTKGVTIPKRHSKFWPPGLDEKLIELYKTHTAKEIGKILNKKAGTVECRIRKLREMGHYIEKESKQFWSKKEDEFVIRHYPNMSVKTMSVKLNRTVQAIKARATYLRSKGIKLERKRLDAWTKDEDTYLIMNYPHKTAVELSKEMNRSAPAIRSRVNKLINMGYDIRKYT